MPRRYCEREMQPGDCLGVEGLMFSSRFESLINLTIQDLHVSVMKRKSRMMNDGLGFRIWGLGFRVQGLGLRV